MAQRRNTNRALREARERKYRLRGGKAKTTRFIPDADSEFASMARYFADHVEKHADRFAISAEKVEELLLAVAAFRDALAAALRRDTAGPRATERKNTARKKAVEVIRSVARYLRGVAEDSFDEHDRLNLNMPARPKRVKRRECPQIAPILKFIGSTDPYGSSANGGRHILEFENDFDRSSSARPHGAARLELFVDLVPVGQPVPTHPGQRSGGRQWFLRSYTTNRFEVDFPVMGDGTPMLVCYWGRWADATGGFGPFSKTCVSRVEGAALPGMDEYARKKVLGAERKQIHVTQLRDEIEAKYAPIAQRVLPGVPARELPVAQRNLLEAG